MQDINWICHRICPLSENTRHFEFYRPNNIFRPLCMGNRGNSGKKWSRERFIKQYIQVIVSRISVKLNALSAIFWPKLKTTDGKLLLHRITVFIAQCDFWDFLSSKQNSANNFFSRQPNTANLAISASSMSVNKV